MTSGDKDPMPIGIKSKSKPKPIKTMTMDGNIRSKNIEAQIALWYSKKIR